jgi:hypothetical protein
MTEKPTFQFSLAKLMLWMAVCAAYTCFVISSEADNLEWLAMSCWPLLIAAFRVRFGSWTTCHFSAIGAGLLLVLGLFFPDPPTGLFEVQYAFITGCGIGYSVFLLVEFVRQLVNRADKLIQRKPDGKE